MAEFTAGTKLRASELDALLTASEEWQPLTLNANYAPRTPLYMTPAFRKTDDGLVHLTGGLLRNSGTAVNNENIGTLPVGYRPLALAQMAGMLGSGVVVGIIVLDTGEVNIAFSGTAHAALYLDGCAFPLNWA